MKAKKAPLRVLIIDNTPENIEAAVEQFAKIKGVELTTISSFDEFDKLFHRYSYHFEKGKNPILQYDVVLTDLMMSESSAEEYPKFEYYSKVEFPFGVSIAAFAKRSGVKHVGVVSRINHHVGPFEWSLDYFQVCYLEQIIRKSGLVNHNAGEPGEIFPLFDAKLTEFVENDQPTGKPGERESDGVYWYSKNQKGWVLVYKYLLGLNQ